MESIKYFKVKERGEMGLIDCSFVSSAEHNLDTHRLIFASIILKQLFVNVHPTHEFSIPYLKFS